MATEPAEVDDGKALGSSPERMCIVTRRRLSPGELIRFARAPDGTITPDVATRLPGRGVWVGLERGLVEQAARSNAFGRSLKSHVVVPDGLSDLVDRLLAERAMQALAIARKAGLLVSGFAKVEAAIGHGGLAALIHAKEAAADGAAKLDRKLAAVNAAATSAMHTEVVTDLASSELSLALGRENVVHAALSTGGAARYFLTEIGRLRHYRSSPPATEPRQPRLRPNTEDA